jgi:hypothetical protein
MSVSDRTFVKPNGDTLRITPRKGSPQPLVPEDFDVPIWVAREGRRFCALEPAIRAANYYPEIVNPEWNSVFAEIYSFERLPSVAGSRLSLSKRSRKQKNERN